MTTMEQTKDHICAAASAVRDVLRGADTEKWSARTPCFDWDLGTLVQHLVGTTTGLAKIGRREDLDPKNPWSGRQVDESTWAPVLTQNLDELAAAWSEPAAWDGTVRVGNEMPARMLGDMAYAEILLHGWDIARTVGGELVVSPEMGAVLRRGVEETAELGRQTGAYGPPVSVPEEASDFDHALGSAGRDPSWRKFE
jgi:uncharacterized protein (TIGR03086 family)